MATMAGNRVFVDTNILRSRASTGDTPPQRVG
jgi:hypothetical protein